MALVHAVASRAQKIRHPFLRPDSDPPPTPLAIFSASQKPRPLMETNFPS